MNYFGSTNWLESHLENTYYRNSKYNSKNLGIIYRANRVLDARPLKHCFFCVYIVTQVMVTTVSATRTKLENN